MKILFDLDGTLICSRKRLYELFCDLIIDRSISFDGYWEFKFQGKNNQIILKDYFGYSDAKIDKFTSEWMELIESDYYLEMDTLIDGVKDFLNKASGSNELYICTARQSISQTIKQLDNFSLTRFFEKIYVTEQKINKEDLMFQSGLIFDQEDWFVGDTGHDINTGKKLGVKTCAVLSGFMKKSALEKYNPDLILENSSLLGVIL